MRHLADLRALLAGDPLRAGALLTVRSLALPDCWVGAGFVRDAVWDHLHGHANGRVTGDIDVIWFDAARPIAEADRAIERRLRELSPALDWSVKNQARMHVRNGDRAYRSAADAIGNWPETATAVAVRIDDDGDIEVNAPFGLDDLFALRLRPTRQFAVERRAVFQQRLAEKRWLERYPLLRVTLA